MKPEFSTIQFNFTRVCILRQKYTTLKLSSKYVYLSKDTNSREIKWYT